jgi:hypothetical protein
MEYYDKMLLNRFCISINLLTSFNLVQTVEPFIKIKVGKFLQHVRKYHASVVNNIISENI